METINLCVMGDSKACDYNVRWIGTGDYMPEGCKLGHLRSEIALVSRNGREYLAARVIDGARVVEDAWLTEWHSVNNGSVRDLDGDNIPSDARLNAAC